MGKAKIFTDGINLSSEDSSKMKTTIFETYELIAAITVGEEPMTAIEKERSYFFHNLKFVRIEDGEEIDHEVYDCAEQYVSDTGIAEDDDEISTITNYHTINNKYILWLIIRELDTILKSGTIVKDSESLAKFAHH